MPRKLLHVKEGIKGTDTPVIVFLSPREVASLSTELRAFKLDDETVIVSNLDKLFNPIDGSVATPIEHSSQKITADEYEQLNDLATMKCRECSSIAGVDPDLSFPIADEPIFCPSCGKESAFAFENEEDLTDVLNADDDVITSVDDTEENDDDADDVEDEDDMSTADDNTREVNDDATVLGDDEDDDDDYFGEDEDDEELAAAKKVIADKKKAKKEKLVKKNGEKASEDGDLTAKTEDAKPIPVEVNKESPASAPEVKQEETTSEDDKSKTDEGNKPVVDANAAAPEAPTPITDPNLVYEQLDAASLADSSAPIKLVTLYPDNSEVAIFMGGSHVGTLRRSQASEKVSNLFADGHKLAAAFKPVFQANMKTQGSNELAAYGYKPVVFDVQVGELFKRRVESEVATVKEQATTAYSTKLKNVGALLELAFTGINKGVFAGNADLLNGIEVALQRGGAKDAKSQARRLLSTHSHNYANAVVEKALELSEKSQDYIDGITETISKATFSDNTEEVRTEEPTAPVAKPVSEVASVDFVGHRPQQANGNKFTSLVSSFRR